ncbi:MAG: hypothetical protein GOP50_05435 [Candidatus Heimdallarchaeota archaeon]|nr:hypothetical protein [Candidatus Heimdallarchaeota archaeon]
MKKYLVSIIVVLFLTANLTKTSTNIQSGAISENNQKISPSIKNLVTSESIMIYSDTDLVEYNFPGNGTEDDPFRIENLLIEEENYGIYINSPKHHFVIQNCHIINAIYGGIVIKKAVSGYANVSNNIIENCTTTHAIFLQSCSEVNIENNICIGNAVGIDMEHSYNSTIVNNLCQNNVYIGIYVESYSVGNIFENNTLRSNGDYGLAFYQSKGSCVYNNSLEDNLFAIIEDTIDDYRGFEVVGNVLDGKKIMYLTDTINQTITDTNIGILFLINCSLILVENLHIENNLAGIFCFGSNNCTFQNNVFVNNYQMGLNILDSNFTLVSNNTFTSTVGGYGFSASYTFYLTIRDNSFISSGVTFGSISDLALPTIVIENNTVNGKELGVFYEEDSVTLSEPEYGQFIFFNCSDVVLRNQIIQDTPIAMTIINSRNFTMTNCEITARDIGISIQYCQTFSLDQCIVSGHIYSGIQFFNSDNLNISNSIIDSNLAAGLEFRAAGTINIDNCEITNNRNGLLFTNINDFSITGSLIANNSRMNIYFNVLDNAFISDVDVYNGDFGIYMNLVDDCFIQNCNILNVNIDGIFLLDSYRVNVMWSNISLNFYGIKIQGTTYSQFLYNSFVGNSVYAISLDLDSRHNLIHHNVFNLNQATDPTGRLSQCWDDGYNNTFYDVETFEGNWWSNIEGYSYAIAGYAYSVDIFPLNPVEVTDSIDRTDESSFSFLLSTITLIIPITSKYYLKKKRKNK